MTGLEERINKLERNELQKQAVKMAGLFGWKYLPTINYETGAITETKLREG